MYSLNQQDIRYFNRYNQGKTSKKHIYLLMSRLLNYMVGEVIPNFDSYTWISVGLFVIGLFAVMVYERSSSKIKRGIVNDN